MIRIRIEKKSFWVLLGAVGKDSERAETSRALGSRVSNRESSEQKKGRMTEVRSDLAGKRFHVTMEN